MASTFFVRIAGDVQGPSDAAKVKQLAVAGRICRDDELSRDRRKRTQARNVKGLVFAATSTSPGNRTGAHGANGAIETNGGNGANGITQYPAPKADSKRTLTACRPAPADALRPSSGAAELDVPLPLGLRTRTTQLPLNLTACPDCGQFVSLRASDCPHCGGPVRRLVPPPQPKQHYRLLRMMSSAYAALGIMVTLAAVFFAVVLIYFVTFVTQNDASGATAAFLAFAACTTAGITCFAASEAMQVFLQIEQNTRAARLAATHRSLSELGG